MALANYTDLKNAVAEWLARPGDATLTPSVPDFIRLAEARIHRDLRLRSMEIRDPAFAIAAAYTALPNGFLELRNIRLNTNPARPLALMAPEQIDTIHAGSGVGTPRVYAVIGDQLRVAPAPSGGMTADIAYWKRFDALSDSQPANWLLTNAPDVYLYATLLEAAAFIGDDERLPLWTGAYDRAVQSLQRSDDRGTWSGSAPVVRTDAGNP